MPEQFLVADISRVEADVFALSINFEQVNEPELSPFLGVIEVLGNHIPLISAFVNGVQIAFEGLVLLIKRVFCRLFA